MEKTKLGLTIPVFGALTYLLFLFGGYTAGLLVVGYVLLCEENADLKKHAMTSLFVAVGISLLNLVIGLLPGMMDIFQTLISVFDGYLDGDIVDGIAAFLYAVLSFVKTVAFVGLTAMTLLGKPIKIGFVDKLLN